MPMYEVCPTVEILTIYCLFSYTFLLLNIADSQTNTAAAGCYELDYELIRIIQTEYNIKFPQEKCTKMGC